MTGKQVDSFSADQTEAKHRDKRKSRLVLLLLWCFLIWCGIALWQFLEYQASVQNHKTSLVQVGRASIHVVASAIKGIGRRRREQPEFLEPMLEEMSSTPHIKAAWLANVDHELVTSTGAVFPLPENVFSTKELWLPEGVVVGERVDIGSCFSERRRGFGRRALAAADSSEAAMFDLFLLLSREKLDGEIAADRFLRLVILGAFFVALTVAFLLLRNRFQTKMLQKELSGAQEIAKRNRQWALLGAGLAHETKNPIAVIRGLAQTISENEPGETEYTRDARRIVHEVDRIVARIDEFLQFSRPIEPDVSAVHFPEFLHEMASLVEADLAPRNGEVEVDAPALTVEADDGMLRQILLNLLVNAAQALDGNQHIVIRAGERRGGTVTLEVIDQGRGIPPGDLEKIFEPYYTRREGGTGLGLSIVKKLVEAHGWDVAVHSTEGEGTNVQIKGIRRGVRG